MVGLLEELDFSFHLRVLEGIPKCTAQRNTVLNECGKCLREEATTQENHDYGFVSLAKYFVVTADYSDHNRHDTQILKTKT